MMTAHATDAPTITPDQAGSLNASLVRMGLLAQGESAQFEPLSGGVSSLIVRADTRAGPVCVKQALARLRVAALWEAPVERNTAEAGWLREAARVIPGAVPAVLGEDSESRSFAMPWLDPAAHPVWKAQLRDGRIDAAFAAAVAANLVKVHAATAGREDLARGFAHDASFHALRLEPYLLTAARAHPDVAPVLGALAATTAATRLALVHGDVSPKNILAGPDGPVLLDAECAWYGDPAFDIAFLCNHLLLKCAWRPQWRARYLASYAACVASYLAGVDWEPRERIEARAAALLPALFLARVDGKSPVEYLTDEAWRGRVRRVARALLASPVARLEDVARAWRDELEIPA